MTLHPAACYSLSALACAAMAAVTDLRSRRVPNLLTGCGFSLGVLLHLVMGGWVEMFTAAAAGLVCGGVFVIFFLAGGMGGGDVKLITAIACLLGWPSVAPLLALTAMAGGLMAVVLAAMRGRMRETLSNVAELVTHHRSEGLTPHPALHVRNEKTLRLPYALAIAAGCVMTVAVQGAVR